MEDESRKRSIIAVNSEANSRRITNVENGFGAAGQPLAVPGRVLVGEGVLVKMCRKKPKPRQFFLFNDILIYGSILISKKRYNRQHIIPLERLSIDDIADDGELKNGWLIKAETKSFAVYAATSTEKTEWMAHIQRCVTELLAKSGRSPSGNYAPAWVPDGDANICMQCKEVKFNLMQRRHHCRKCGAVVCGGCSNKKFKLPAISRSPVRVCKLCYQSLQYAPTNQSPVNNKSMSTDAINDGENSDESSSDDEDDDRNATDGEQRATQFYEAQEENR